MATINLTEQEIGAVLSAVSIRLNGIRGYCLSEEDYLNSAKEKLEKCLTPSTENKAMKRNNSPEGIVELCEYVGQSLTTLELSKAQVDVAKELAVPVKYIRMDYPFPVEQGSYNVYQIQEVKTWGELLTEIIKVFQREYKIHEDKLIHNLSDYIIEPVVIHPNNAATVMIGS
ncbi:MAG: hypothetical protein IKQ37_12205 [Bacteroidaceae bacterium]|nr:hypothetical protein [Bacteroidaceae bacterium]